MHDTRDGRELGTGGRGGGERDGVEEDENIGREKEEGGGKREKEGGSRRREEEERERGREEGQVRCRAYTATSPSSTLPSDTPGPRLPLSQSMYSQSPGSISNCFIFYFLF